ncbi:MAG TPA: RNA-binding protein, partial [Candidatus Bathyarchaeota archaeon]|nr:RNA-binding protein [Candidatus Bathyarchaeota archaeon]
RGVLEGFDQHINLVLRDAEDISDPENVEKIGTIILRGDNVVMISPPP